MPPLVLVLLLVVALVLRYRHTTHAPLGWLGRTQPCGLSRQQTASAAAVSGRGLLGTGRSTLLLPFRLPGLAGNASTSEERQRRDRAEAGGEAETAEGTAKAACGRCDWQPQNDGQWGERWEGAASRTCFGQNPLLSRREIQLRGSGRQPWRVGHVSSRS